MLNDNQFVRFYRHILMPEIGESGQQAFINAKVVIVGMGGLGCAASQYLAASGVGELVLIDHDKVALSNLQRQILFTDNDIGVAKVEAAARRLTQLNHTVKLTPIAKDVLECHFATLVSDADVILDCSDNAPTRHVINATCFKQGKTLVSASAMGMQGQLVSFDFSHQHGPCYCCLFPDQTKQTASCQSHGVFSPLLGIMGSMQAGAAMQLLLGNRHLLNRLYTVDAESFQRREFGVVSEPACRVCSA